MRRIIYFTADHPFLTMIIGAVMCVGGSTFLVQNLKSVFCQ